ncbi:MAG: AraC family transcriptional regulator [Butyrivibrio sp.]|nr:AraC family transcriptional regulator [Butyrivibrio sp.]
MTQPENYSYQVEVEGLQISETHVYNKKSMKTRHFHETIELFVLTTGERYFFVDRYVYHMKSHMAVLIASGQIHKTSLVEAKPEHSRFLLQYSKEIFEGMMESSLDLSYDEICHKYGGMIAFSDEGWIRITEKYEELKKEADREPGSPLYNPALIKCIGFEILLIYIKEMENIQKKHQSAIEEDSYRVQSGVYNTIENVTDYINENFSEDITLDMLSEKFYISRAGLTRAFKNITGITVIQYLTIVRVRKACFYLKNTSDSITEISEKCGFGNVTYFEKVFRRSHGMTPRQYRGIL